MTPESARGEVRIVRPAERDRDTAQTPGMQREAAISGSTVGSRKLWVGIVTMAPGARSGAHHHGPVESSIYIISGRARFRFGPRLEHTVEAAQGDFVFVPPQAVHQEISVDAEAPVEMIVARSGQENVVVNVDLPEQEG